MGGVVADGSGSAPVLADLVIQDGVVREVLPPGNEYGDGSDIVNCRGLVVSPGFVDIHTHSDLSLFSYPGNESRVTQGITTEVVGNCGMTPAPSSGDNAGLALAIGPIDQVPDFEWTWNDFEGWFSALDALPKATNVAAHVGHGSARFTVAGPQARPLTGEELVDLDRELRIALECGAVGISLGLMYAPGEGATMSELVQVARTASDFDGVLSVHMRDYVGPGLLMAVHELIEVVEQSGARTEISHLRQSQSRRMPRDSFTEVLDAVEGARSRVNIAADAYPYLAGYTNLIQLFPSEIRGQGATAITRFCRDHQKEAAAALAASGYAIDDLIIMKARSAPEVMGKSAADLDGDKWLGLVGLLIANDCQVDVVLGGSNWADVDLGYERPWLNVASDGQAFGPRHSTSVVHPRSWGTFPAAYRRLRANGITIGESVRRLSDGPASQVGLSARLQPGHRADVTVFEEKTLDSAATFQAPNKAASGVRYVYVGGSAVLYDGVTTEARPGQLIRRG